MTKLRCQLSISLDGFVAGPDQSVEDPLGEGGMQLHEWVFGLAAWREPHGLEGGEVNASTKVVEESLENIGATVMGRNMFGAEAPGERTRGTAGGATIRRSTIRVFVVTHHAREPLAKQGGTTFTFVTDGIESALEQAREAAGGKDVALGGGADIVQQYLRAGLIDELQLHVVPVLLGGGARLFDGLAGAQIALECTQVIDAPGVTHLTYRTSLADS